MTRQNRSGGWKRYVAIGPGALAELLGKPDNDALRSADVGQPVRVLVLHFANELGPVGAHARNDSVDVINGEHNARRRPLVFIGAFTGPNLIAVGVWNLSSSMPNPSGVRIVARVARTSLRPIRFPTDGPSTVDSPS